MIDTTLLDRRAALGLLRELQQLEREDAEDKRWLTAVVEEAAERASKRNVRADEIRGLLEQIVADMRLPGSQHVDVPGIARIQFRTTEPSLRIAEPEAFIQWARDHERHDLIKVKTTTTVIADAAKDEAARALSQAGELLPGVIEEPEHTSMSIRFTEAR